MKPISVLVICAAFSALAGCAEPDHYPISGQECSAEDTVHDLSASDCVPPV